MEKYCLLTNDVETHSIWYNTLRDETGKKVLEEGMPILLDLYQKYNVKSTFYFTGYIAEKFPEVVKMILPYGHEVGSHGYSHEVFHGFDVLSYKDQVEHLRKSKQILEDISGQEVISFRAPALRVNSNTSHALIETGFRTDSSVASQRFDMFMSFGGLKKLKWLSAPRLPYRTAEGNLFKKGNSPLVEIPLTAMIFPYVGTTMRIFPTVTKMQRQVLHAETSMSGKPLVFDIHPNEFIEEANGARTVERRATNFVSYVLADLIRGQLKVKNLGRKAIPLYENKISYYSKRGYKFLTIQDYCKEKGLL
ncbi:MAG: polysaccharide deacetylase family protein [Bacteroidia bacterium]